MKQLSIISDCTDPIRPPKESSTIWKLFIDGASRNNPGRAGAGVYLLKDEKPIYQEGFYLGIKTNNEAEYLALLLGIFSCKRLLCPDDLIYVISDSELLVKQIKGDYKVRKLELKNLYDIVILLLHNMNYSFCHVLRQYNKQADKLANKGIENGTPLPKDFLTLMQDHGFSM